MSHKKYFNFAALGRIEPYEPPSDNSVTEFDYIGLNGNSKQRRKQYRAIVRSPDYAGWTIQKKRVKKG